MTIAKKIIARCLLCVSLVAAASGCGDLLESLQSKPASTESTNAPGQTSLPGQGQPTPAASVVTTPSTPVRPEAVGMEVLNEQGIDTRTLMFVGPDLFITYEASNALDYDEQIFVVWGVTLGVLAELTSGMVTIVNTAGGEPALLVKASSTDIRAYTSGSMDFETYMSKIQFIPVPG